MPENPEKINGFERGGGGFVNRIVVGSIPTGGCEVNSCQASTCNEFGKSDHNPDDCNQLASKQAGFDTVHVGIACRIEPSFCAGRPIYHVDPTSGCWVWRRQKTKEGYGKFEHEGRQIYAHRWSYEKHVGPIPHGLVIDHICNNKACINPDHLRPTTDAENIRRGRAPKLSMGKAKAIRSRFIDGESVESLARRYGVKPACIRNVIKGMTWATAPAEIGGAL